MANSALIAPHEMQIESSVPDALWYSTGAFAVPNFSANMNLPFYQDERVRKAIHYSVDFEALANPQGDWLWSSPNHVMFLESHTSDEVKAMRGYNPATKAEDTAEAQKMLAGYGRCRTSTRGASSAGRSPTTCSELVVDAWGWRAAGGGRRPARPSRFASCVRDGASCLSPLTGGPLHRNVGSCRAGYYTSPQYKT